MRVYWLSETLKLCLQGLNIEVGPPIASQSRGPVLKKQESLVVGAVRPLLFAQHTANFYFHSNSSNRIFTSSQIQRLPDSFFAKTAKNSTKRVLVLESTHRVTAARSCRDSAACFCCSHRQGRTAWISL